MIDKRVNVKLVNKNFVEVNKNINTKGNLIPIEYRKVFWTLLGSQDKWNLVIDKVVTKLDELDQPVTINVKETTTP